MSLANCNSESDSGFTLTPNFSWVFRLARSARRGLKQITNQPFPFEELFASRAALGAD